MNKLCEKKNFNIDKICNILLIVYIIIQPFLDNYMTIFDKYIQIAGISLATIIRYFLMFLLILPIFIKNIKRKSTKILITYLVLCLIYTIFHLINARNLDMSLLSKDASYSVIGEIFYISRMIMPILLIYVIYILKPKYKDIKIIVISVLTIISAILLITNIFGVAYIAYSVDEFRQIGNIFSWFTGKTDPPLWKFYTCRGMFRSGNELSALCTMLLSIMMYISFKEKNKIYWFPVLLTLVSLLMLSTRIAVLIGTALFFGMFLLYIFMCIIKKESFQISNVVSFIIVSIIFLLLLSKSPFEFRKISGDLNFDDFNIMSSPSDTSIDNTQNPNVDSTQKENYKKEIFQNDEEKIKYIKDRAESSGINAMFPTKIYRAESDIDFYINLINNVPYAEKYGSRNMKHIIMERIYERNSNPSDKWFGMSYLKITTCLYPERDFESHFYCIGLLGILLFIVPYFIIIVLGGIDLLKNFKKKFNMYTLIFLESASLCLVCGFFSGHVLDEIFVNTFLAFVCGIILVNVNAQN